MFGALWGGSRGRSPRGLPAQLRIGSAVAVVLYAAFTVVILGPDDVLTLVVTRVVPGFETLSVILNAIPQQPSDQ